MQPGLPPAPPPMPGAAAARLAAAARTLLRDGRAEEALPMLDRLGALEDAKSTAALRAEALLQLGRPEEAEEAADAAMAGLPEAAPLRRLRARIRLARGRHAPAAEDAAAAVMAEPGDLAGRLLLAAALLEAGRHDEAIWFLGEAWRADPGNPTLQLRLGQAFLRAGRHAAAAEILAQCEATAPGTPGIAALRAQAALLAGAAGEAEAIARAALARGVAEAALHSLLAHALVQQGRLAEAGPHFAAAARLAPGSDYLAHLAAAAGGTAADRAPAAYVATLFDGYAPHFEASLLGLGYRVPGLVRRALERRRPAIAAGQAALGPVLDLGCGTGLVGVALSDLPGGPLTGIDLSAAMLEQAAAKGLYAGLRQADIVDALRQDTGAYALIIAADVFCYLGALEPVLALCRARLAPGGLLVFSLERAEPGAAWRLGPQGRYAHAPDYLAACLAGAGLRALECREEALRRDAEQEVPGLLVVADAADP
ncbi:tetratricopeptide repeat protein [Paracraurococcus lichenis]|uniref:Tetratricopeptide repeat protein n=1 Tax=Paracraurococcus lichenis TaxID=3064888 RepID=A0ABT9DST9_9PROT|nr:tetratricopeptide repeat protein [Paracraurococcus sp. LOR1-02]MDO9706973.1 tetratricopeptide repeat protein [Paracraurococcus sp. LOR1-02]